MVDITVDDIWDAIRGPLVDILLRILYVIIIFVIGRFIIYRIHKLVEALLERDSKLDSTIAGFMASMLKFGLNFILFVICINQLGVDNTSFIAVAGAAAFALAFALQGSMANFAAGVVLLSIRPFAVGHFVTIADTTGYVAKIALFTTEMRDLQHRRIIIPNGDITSMNITNWCAEDKIRADFDVSIAYSDDIRRARDVSVAIMNAHPLVELEPAPSVAVKELGDHGVTLQIQPWLKTHPRLDIVKTQREILESIKFAFDRVGLNFPFPQQDVHLDFAAAPGDDAIRAAQRAFPGADGESKSNADPIDIQQALQDVLEPLAKKKQEKIERKREQDLVEAQKKTGVRKITEVFRRRHKNTEDVSSSDSKLPTALRDEADQEIQEERRKVRQKTVKTSSQESLREEAEMELDTMSSEEPHD